MIELLVAAPGSGSGKTVVSCALMAALRQQGKRVTAFKCGPDYIDPTFHREVMGLESHNLDLFLAGEQQVRAEYRRWSGGCDAAICEGVMGYYDGVGGVTSQAGSWALADALELPVLLVLKPKGASLTLAALVNGLKNFVPRSRIAGLFLNDCKPMLFQTLAPMLQEHTGLPVLGYLPPMEQAKFQSRHLGLYTAPEIQNLQERLEALGKTITKTMDWSSFASLFERPETSTQTVSNPSPRVRIAVAQDAAFRFVYPQTLEAFRRSGAEPVFFSPLQDAQLPPAVGGLYLPGGYPELYAEELSRNDSMRQALATAISHGLPAVAECGGFLYLGQTLQGTDGRDWPMVGALPGRGIRTDRLVRFGYLYLTAEKDSLLFRKGESVPAHEFHYWDSTCSGTSLEAKKPVSGRSWHCGFVAPNLYAGFPHLWFSDTLASRFVCAAAKYDAKERD